MEIITKGWGYEKVIVNHKDYCGKILHFEKGLRCSWHYHCVKAETFYCATGRLLIKYGNTDDLESAQELILEAGMSFDVPVGLRHQMIALEESDLYEFSTHHAESDSIRIIKGD